MKIKRFCIEAYRSCIKTAVPFNAELTSLIGINGAGKSSVLNGIQLLKKSCRIRYSPIQETEFSTYTCKISVDIEQGDKCLYLKGRINYDTDEKNTDFVISSEIKCNLKDYTGKSEWLVIPIEFVLNFESSHITSDNRMINHRRWWFNHKYIEKIVEINRYPLIKEAIELLNSISYYSASQFSDPSRCPVSIELEDNKPVRRTRYSTSHDQFILDLYKSFKADEVSYKKYINAVNSNGIGLIDSISFTEVEMPSSSYEVRSGGKIHKIEKNRLLVVPNINIDGNNLSPNQLSEGTFKTLALVYYILTDSSKVLLIEEPEVCIHHGLLSSIIELIKTQSKKKQIIISTHSDFVLDHLEPDNIVLVKKSEKSGTTVKPLNKYMSKNDYKALKTYLEESGNLGEYWKEGGFDNE
ncbi:AAA family ATPase [Pelotalea chapellei]|uniref:AAA family ATPase n=1 Tax=Pelotalea chapellei TaxID=44671 RepID=A0ABS5U5Y2_9BACT|nr:ATP-binding protein [Pelotalea chapellei]MBT1071073.1 AAA family ATPase [Pelotalea chapellei]